MRRKKADMRETYKILNSDYRLNPQKLFETSTESSRGHNLKLNKQHSRTDIRKELLKIVAYHKLK